MILEIIFKNALVTSFLTGITLGLSPMVQAEAIPSLEDNQSNCLGQLQCSSSTGIKDAQKSPELEEVDSDNEIRDTELDIPEGELDPQESEKSEEAEKSGGISGYAGATLGIFFPDVDESRPFFIGNDVDVNTGFGGSLFSGIRFNRYLATDIEISSFGGDIDSDLDEDESYIIWSLFLNPRFTLPLTKNQNSVALYLSPGIGISQFSSSVEDEIADLDRTTTIKDETRFSWQIKGGVSVPVSKKFSVLAQLRYTSQTGDDAIDYWGPELGINFKF